MASINVHQLLLSSLVVLYQVIYTAAIYCGDPPSIANGWVDVEGRLVGDEAHYYCNTGYNRIGDSSLECNWLGEWEGTQPYCRIVNCRSPAGVANGYVTTDRTTYGGTARYYCNEGFILQGVNPITCTTSGSWSAASPTCPAIDCGIPPAVSYASVEYTSTEYEAVASYTCSIGYTLSGPSEITCDASGWGSGTPTISCEVTDCGALPMVPNGMVEIDHTQYGGVATYTCNEGFELIGSGNVLVCGTSGSWSADPPECQAVDCGSPPDVTGGSVSAGSTTYGATAVYQCNEGFQLSGTNSTTCGASRSWSAPAPTCQRRAPDEQLGERRGPECDLGMRYDDFHNGGIFYHSYNTYHTHSLCSDDHISIQGSRLLDGLRADDYTVTVGDEPCTEITVTSDEIKCKPPTDEPDDTTVRVTIGNECFTVSLSPLEYKSSAFDCSITMVIIGVVVGVLVLVILIAIAAICCKRRQRQQSKAENVEGAVRPAETGNNNYVHNSFNGTKLNNL